MGKADFKKINDRWSYDEDSRKKIDNFYTNEKMPHKKKKEKNTKKKSDHKHIYRKVLLKLIRDNKYPWLIAEHYSIGEKCEICGKINLTEYFITEKRDDGYYTVLESKEILKKYSNLEVIPWKDI